MEDEYNNTNNDDQYVSNDHDDVDNDNEEEDGGEEIIDNDYDANYNEKVFIYLNNLIYIYNIILLYIYIQSLAGSDNHNYDNGNTNVNNGGENKSLKIGMPSLIIPDNNDNISQGVVPTTPSYLVPSLRGRLICEGIIIIIIAI